MTKEFTASEISPESSFVKQQLATVNPKRYRGYAPSPVGSTRGALELCREALQNPIGAPSVESMTGKARSIVVIVNDETRDEPREAMLTALAEVLPWTRVTLVIASGTHQATNKVIPSQFGDRPVIVHDGARLDRCIDLGRTSEGTRIRLLREVAEADLVVVTGRIRPHYFAGYSGGAKGIFPGCAYNEDVLQNHRLKEDPSARLGQVEGNRCRKDMEEAAAKICGSSMVLNLLADCNGGLVAAAFGHLIDAHRALLDRARSLFEVSMPSSSVMIVSDRCPVTDSLYQASKLLPPCGPVLTEKGIVIMVADCRDGTGPLDRVNQGIYQSGVARQLPRGHRIILVSQLPSSVVDQTYAAPRHNLNHALDWALSQTGAHQAALLWRAGESIGVRDDN